MVYCVTQPAHVFPMALIKLCTCWKDFLSSFRLKVFPLVCIRQMLHSRTLKSHHYKHIKKTFGHYSCCASTPKWCPIKRQSTWLSGDLFSPCKKKVGGWGSWGLKRYTQNVPANTSYSMSCSNKQAWASGRPLWLQRLLNFITNNEACRR